MSTTERNTLENTTVVNATAKMEKVIKRVNGWTARDYAKFYLRTLIESGMTKAHVDMTSRRDTVTLIGYTVT